VASLSSLIPGPLLGGNSLKQGLTGLGFEDSKKQALKEEDRTGTKCPRKLKGKKKTGRSVHSFALERKEGQEGRKSVSAIKKGGQITAV